MRNILQINQGWQFGPCVLQGPNPPAVNNWQPVFLPHVWNIDDPAQEGPRAYWRNLNLETPGENNQYYLSFGAVAGVCRVWLNGQFIGEHRGGYACFRMALNSAAQDGVNELVVVADNTRYDDIIPLGGDFNNYGGIYREVELISVGRTHFDLLHFGSSGVEIDAGPEGTIRVKPRLVGTQAGTTIRYVVSDQSGVCLEQSCDAALAATELSILNPHLWDGRADPWLYQLSAQILFDNEVVDEISLPFGFRTIQMTPDRGFFLNGRHLLIQGVCKHQDREGAGCAPSREQLEEDMQLILEIGANALRLAHYQHPQAMVDLCDRAGLVVWAEIPMLAMPDGNDALMENARQQLTELILQNKHHPSVCFWGIQNEIAMMGESLEMYRKTDELDQLARQLDASRITTSANLYCVKNKSQLNHITDMVGYNQYFGWYNGEMPDYGPFFDQFHADNPGVPLGLSEYGVDCSVQLHSAEPKRKDYSEEFQCLFHETVYPLVQSRPFLWGSFVWNMFDFGSAIRNEGGTKGKNCKGLVTFDRSIKKDAFYYYKACWAQDSFVYIAGRRFTNRCGENTTIKVYSNQDEVTLWANGAMIATSVGKAVFVFSNVPLQPGENTIHAVAGDHSDEIILNRVEKPETSYVFIDPNPGIDVANWFTLGQSQDDLFPADRYSIMDEMGDLVKNEQVWALLEREIPQIARDPRTKAIKQMTLLTILNWAKGQFTEDQVKKLNSELNLFSKP